MNKLIQKWLDAQDYTSNALKEENDALDEAESAKLPLELVKAEAKDIVVGNIIWYPRWVEDDEDCRLWNIVEDVLYPDDDWKAYCAQDGSRYGLDGAFVEIK